MPPGISYRGIDTVLGTVEGLKRFVGTQASPWHGLNFCQGTISEMIPAGEAIENWTEMVTVQIFLNMRDVTPAQYRVRMQKLWGDACPGSAFSKVKEGIENGYATLTWLQKCPVNKQTGKPELTWMKAMQGKDSFYLVQKAYKFEPSAEQRRHRGQEHGEGRGGAVLLALKPARSRARRARRGRQALRRRSGRAGCCAPRARCTAGGA